MDSSSTYIPGLKAIWPVWLSIETFWKIIFFCYFGWRRWEMGDGRWGGFPQKSFQSVVFFPYLKIHCVQEARQGELQRWVPVFPVNDAHPTPQRCRRLLSEQIDVGFVKIGQVFQGERPFFMSWWWLLVVWMENFWKKVFFDLPTFLSDFPCQLMVDCLAGVFCFAC